MNEITLPAEIKEQALKVSKEKQAEVLKVLTDIFNGTADWEKQVDKIVIKDINDKMSIDLADVARKNAKTARLNAEKIFDEKRLEVQLKMSDYKLEDSLWLKSKQIMQLKFKHIEEKAKFKSEYVKRYEIEQKELQTEQRINKVIKFNPEINRFEIEDMTNDVFDIYLSGLEKEYNERIAKEKAIKEEEIRKEKERIAEEKRIREENERLKKEAEAKEKLRIEEEKKRKAKEEKERKLREEQERKQEAIYQANLEKERKEKAKIFAELKAKEEKEKAEKQRLVNERNVKLKAEKSARLAPDKDKLLALANDIISFKLPELKSEEANSILKNVHNLLTKTSNYINENTNNLL